jgi:hypothetical protein
MRNALTCWYACRVQHSNQLQRLSMICRLIIDTLCTCRASFNSHLSNKYGIVRAVQTQCHSRYIAQLQHRSSCFGVALTLPYCTDTFATQYFQSLYIDTFMQNIINSVDEEENAIDLQADGSWKIHVEPPQPGAPGMCLLQVGGGSGCCCSSCCCSSCCCSSCCCSGCCC